MAMVPADFWVPASILSLYAPIAASTFPAFLDAVLDADEEEVQFIGQLYLEGGPGTSKTFGGGSSALEFLVGAATITFQATATLRCGVKQASSISSASGPPARATVGAAAFDVYGDLVGGTDTLTALTPKSIAMGTGTLAVTHCDMIAVCLHLDITSNAQAIRARGITSSFERPSTTLVTSGPTFTRQDLSPYIVLTMSDGTRGWLFPVAPVFNLTSPTIGNTNILGNIVNLPYDCSMDAVAGHFTSFGGTGNLDMGIWTDPLGTPSAFAGNVSVDPQQIGAGGNRVLPAILSQKYSYTKNGDIFVAAKQNSATGVTLKQVDLNDTAYRQAANSKGVYAASSTAGAAAAALNSGKSLMHMAVHVCEVSEEVGAGGSGGGIRIAGHGGLAA